MRENTGKKGNGEAWSNKADDIKNYTGNDETGKWQELKAEERAEQRDKGSLYNGQLSGTASLFPFFNWEVQFIFQVSTWQTTIGFSFAGICFSAKSLNPRPAGVFDRTQPTGMPNSRTRGRSEVGEAANESSRWVLFKQILKIFLKGHMSGQGQVKGQNRHFSPYRLLRRD